VGYITLGRRLGRGTRIIVDRVGRQAQVAARQAAETARLAAETAQQKAPQYVAQRRAMAVGGKRFGQSFWKRLAHAGRTLWHEVTGVFFALFAVFFAQGMWRVHDAYLAGAEHEHFMLYLAMTILFTYFSVSAFVRSRRRPH